MKFIDLSQYKITEMKRYSTMRLILKADKYLNSSLKDASDYMDSLFKVRYKSPSVYYDISIDAKDTELSLDDFQYLCEAFLSAIFRKNALLDKRPIKDKQHILNILPGNRWALKGNFMDQINVDMSTMLFAADHLYWNRNINVHIESSDGQFKYDLIKTYENVDTDAR